MFSPRLWAFRLILESKWVIMTGIRGYVESLGMQFGADWFGKIKLIVQCIAIGTVIGLFAFDWPPALHRFLDIGAHVFVWATLVTTIASGASYVMKTRRLLGQGA